MMKNNGGKFMLKKLKYILNSYSDEELENMRLWINSLYLVEDIVINDNAIVLRDYDTSFNEFKLMFKED